MPTTLAEKIDQLDPDLQAEIAVLALRLRHEHIAQRKRLDEQALSRLNASPTRSSKG